MSAWSSFVGRGLSRDQQAASPGMEDGLDKLDLVGERGASSTTSDSR